MREGGCEHLEHREEGRVGFCAILRILAGLPERRLADKAKTEPGLFLIAVSVLTLTGQ